MRSSTLGEMPSPFPIAAIVDGDIFAVFRKSSFVIFLSINIFHSLPYENGIDNTHFTMI
jgi:hypothetical protein